MTLPPAIAGLLLGIGLTAACGGSSASTPVSGSATSDRTAFPNQEAAWGAVADRAQLEAFIDGVMSSTLQDQRIAGGAVAIVKDGSVLLAKGYGYANVERQVPVDSQRTLFRIGSVTKLFTATAVMQLVENGQLALDADVNRYLDFELPATYPEPITLTHLLTHTAGFEDDGRDLWTSDPRHLAPLGRWLAAHVPARVRPPGVFAAYSNFSSAFAGYVVERVSGLPWDDYLEQRILEPLGMTRTTGRQPLPARFADDMSQGYRRSRGTFEPRDWELLMGASPAGAMSATAADMATFMLAHLGNGAVGDRRILRDETAARMHARTFAHDPRMPGIALGFYERSSHGLRILAHSGDTQWFHTDLALVPSERLGVFVSYNTDTAAAPGLAPLPFLRTFLDHYYPDPLPAVAAGADVRAQAPQASGEYRFNRMSYTTFQKAFSLVGAVRISPQPDGSLSMASRLGDRRLLPVGPLLYREEAGTELVAFKADGTDRATHAFIGALPMMALERVSWYESARLHWLVLGIGVVTFAAVGRSALERRIRRRRSGEPADALPGRSILLMIALAHLIFVVTFVVLLSDPVATLAYPAVGIRIALIFPLAGAAFTALATAIALRHWVGGLGTRAARIRYDAVVVIGLLFLWSLRQWNLLTIAL
ncbi:MAG: beta-lactamase family protein [Acidobacteria bacterium]|nr:beta-lactamase family protein [Acidobacteriota bacterium]